MVKKNKKRIIRIPTTQELLDYKNINEQKNQQKLNDDSDYNGIIVKVYDDNNIPKQIKLETVNNTANDTVTDTPLENVNINTKVEKNFNPVEKEIDIKSKPADNFLYKTQNDDFKSKLNLFFKDVTSKKINDRVENVKQIIPENINTVKDHPDNIKVFNHQVKKLMSDRNKDLYPQFFKTSNDIKEQENKIDNPITKSIVKKINVKSHKRSNAPTSRR